MEKIKLPAGIPLVPIERLKAFEKNSRTHSQDQVEQIAASIAEIGFTNPILIDDKDVIIAGHGRLMAANHLGLSEVPVIVISGLTDEQKRAYVIADNKIALNSGWDEKLLQVELESLRGSKFDLSLTGFSESELEDFFEEPEPPKPRPSRKVVEDPTPLMREKLQGTVEAPTALPKPADPEIPTHKLKADVHPADKKPAPQVPKGDSVSRIGDVWVLGKHELKCARVMDLTIDRLVLHWQELTGKDAIHKKTKKSFTDLGIARSNKKK